MIAATAVGDDTTVELVERVRDELRREDVVDRDRVAVHRVRIARGMLAHLHCDRRELLGLRTVLIHVPLRGHRVRTHQRHARSGTRTPSAWASASRLDHHRRHRCRVCAPTPTADCCRTRSRPCRRRRPGSPGTRASCGTRSSIRRTTSTRATGAAGRGTRRARPRACRRIRHSRSPRSRRVRGRRRRARAGTIVRSSMFAFISGVTGPSASPTPTTQTFLVMSSGTYVGTKRHRKATPRVGK